MQSGGTVVAMDEDRAPRTTMTTRVQVKRVGGVGAGSRVDLVVVEEPLRINIEQGDVRGVLGSTMRTPGHDLELAVGLSVGINPTFFVLHSVSNTLSRRGALVKISFNFFIKICLSLICLIL